MNKEKVLELAREAELARQFALEVPFVVDRLERFVALIEREVRGDAEPVGYTNEGYKGMQYANAESYNQIRPDFIERNKLTAPLYKHPTPAASAESVASVHIKDGCLIGSQRKSGVDIPDGQYALYPIGTFPAPAVDAEPVAWMTQSNDLLPIFHKTRAAAMNWESRPTPLYTHPSPAVVRQLVEALEQLMSIVKIYSRATSNNFAWAEMDFAKEALAAAKGYTA